MGWPFAGVFAPLSDRSVEVMFQDGSAKLIQLSVIELGDLRVQSGRLLACDPFVAMPQGVVADVPAGNYRTRVTVADVSRAQDRSHLREAYLSVVISNAPSISRSVIVPHGKLAPQAPEFYGVAVDAGTVAFVDEENARNLMPSGDVYNEVFDSGRADSWFNQMDSESPLPKGYANIRLPLAKNGENIVIAHSGWGDGFYPVLATYDELGRLTGVHIDLQVIGDFREGGPASA